MKTIKFLSAIAVFSLLLIGCSNHEEFSPNDGGKLSIRTEFENLQNSNGLRFSPVKQSFSHQDKMGLYMKKEQSAGYWFENLRAEFLNGKWELYEDVFLTSENVGIYAYYPYDANVDDLCNIEVSMYDSVDYLVGKSTASINNMNTAATIKMKHAMSMLQFAFKKTNFDMDVKLTKIEIKDKTGQLGVSTDGTLNLESQAITPKAYKPIMVEYSDILKNGITSQYPDEKDYLKVFIIPSMQESQNKGDLSIEFTLGNRVYTWDLDGGTRWDAGYKSTYFITLSGSELIVESVTIEEWKEGKQENIYLY